MAPLVSHKGSAVQQALVKRGGEGPYSNRWPVCPLPTPHTGTHIPRSPRSR